MQRRTDFVIKRLPHPAVCPPGPIFGGFTIVELLVTVVILATLVGLLAPAVQSARESVRRAGCANNLRQLGLGILMSAETGKALPPAVILGKGVTRAGDYRQGFGPNWAVLLLPFIEQGPLYDQARAGVAAYAAGTSGTAWRVVRTTRLPLMNCVSDAYGDVAFAGPGGDWMRGNYAANAGPGMFYAGKVGDQGLRVVNGMFVETAGMLSKNFGQYLFPVSPRGVLTANSRVRLAQVSDGTSRTILLDEVRVGTTPADLRGTWALGQVGASIVAGSGRVDSPGPNAGLPGYDDIMDGSNDPARGMGCEVRSQSHQVTAKSMHVGGVNACLADGSVRFLEDATDRGVYQLLHSRDDGLDR